MRWCYCCRPPSPRARSDLVSCSAPPGNRISSAGPTLPRFVFILLFIGLSEEPAWRGFALPRLIAEHSALAASLILGVLHIVWHLPLFGIEYNA